MSSATILFCDIVGFSRKSDEQQRDLVQSLTSEVLKHIGKHGRRLFRRNEILALPTGDGVALAFLHHAKKSWSVNTVLGLCIGLHRWAHQRPPKAGKVQLRVGIHVGATEFVADVNGRTNICGDCINLAQRVMDAANPAQTLLSSAAFRHYFGTDNTPIEVNLDNDVFQVTASQEFETYAKHSVRLLVRSLQLSAAKEWFNSEDPYSKNLMVLSLTGLPKEIGGGFSERLVNADEVAFVELNGDRLLTTLEAGTLVLPENMKKLWVAMAALSPEDVAQYGAIITGSTDIKTVHQRWLHFLETYKSSNNGTDVRLIIFDEPPFFGASFLNWTSIGGRIHISPYIWNRSASSSPGYDIDWVGSAESEVYKAYSEGLTYIFDRHRNLV